MTLMFKARYSIFYSLLSVSIVCQSFAATSSNLKRTGSGNLQIAESDNPREALKKSIYAVHNVKSFRVRIEGSFAGSSSKATIILEHVSPDRTHSIRNNEEFISIGEQVYRKMGDGPWKKYSEKNNEIAVLSLSDLLLEEDIKAIDNVGDVELIGRDIVDGTPTLVYTRTIYLGPNKTAPSSTKLWLAAADGLWRRTEWDGEVNSKKGVVVSTYYDYNADIKIETPAIDASKDVVDQKPIPLNNPSPRYTEEARRNKSEGIVVAQVLIGPDGSVMRVTITRGLPDGLDEQAIDAAYQLKFKPAMKDGQPVAYLQIVQIEFKLRNDRIR